MDVKSGHFRARRWICRGVLLLCNLVLAAHGPGSLQAEEAQSRDPEVERRFKALEERNQKLEERNDKLEARVGELESNKAAAGSAGADTDGFSFDEERPGLGMVARYGQVEATFQVFGDVGFRYQNPAPPAQSNSSFFFGSLDLFATAQVAERLHLVSESLIRPAGGSIGINQERLWGAWTFADALFVKLGTEHTPTSRWIRTYHHGKWLEPSIDRPFLARFEGNDGFLPIHYAGVEVGGSVDLGFGRVDYIGIVSNGRGITPEDRQVLSDRNNAKAFDAHLAFSPACLSSLHVGGALRADDIPASPSSGWTRSIREIIGSSFVELRTGPLEALGDAQVEAIAEVAYVENKVRSSDSTFQHHSWYAQVGYRINNAWMPYARFDSRSMERNDPFFASFSDSSKDRDLDKWEQVLGVRYDFSTNAALKVELVLGREERRDGAETSKKDFVSVAMQLAWVF